MVILSLSAELCIYQLDLKFKLNNLKKIGNLPVNNHLAICYFNYISISEPSVHES